MQNDDPPEMIDKKTVESHVSVVIYYNLYVQSTPLFFERRMYSEASILNKTDFVYANLSWASTICAAGVISLRKKPYRTVSEANDRMKCR